MASNVAENMIAATNIMFAIMNAFKSSVQQAKYNAAKIFEQPSKDTRD
jgi:hypothetical protein